MLMLRQGVAEEVRLVLERFLQYVEPSHELAVDVQLWKRGPVAEGLHSRAHGVVLEHVEVPEADAVLAQQLHELAGVAAAGLLRVALDENHDWDGVHELREAGLELGAERVGGVRGLLAGGEGLLRGVARAAYLLPLGCSSVVAVHC